MLRRGMGLVVMLAATVGSGAAEVSPAADATRPPDKSGYTLFQPVPRELMREMSTDRPDQTESAYTVDAGHSCL